MDSELPFRIEDIVLLEGLNDDRHGGINRIGDDKNESIGASGCNSSSKVSDNTSVYLDVSVSIE